MTCNAMKQTNMRWKKSTALHFCNEAQAGNTRKRGLTRRCGGM
uniref:Uncharacterized protein n=1 Tax=Arundo donax TaxID=35708 RepID=A0A0A8YGG2_ARUDO